MEYYFLGIDGGGTKTKFECYSAGGDLVAEYQGPTCHVLQVTSEEAINVLTKGILQIISQLPQKDVKLIISAGLAGYGSNFKLRQSIEQICSKAFKGYSYYLTNDAEIALYGALDGEDGILLIAGTGSIALLKSEHTISRCGGWGYQLGDEGSGYWLGNAMINTFTKQSDGRLPRTNFYYRLREVFKLSNDSDLISFFEQDYAGNRKKVASLAKELAILANDMDETALSLYCSAAIELAEMANCLGKKQESNCSVSYAGGVWNVGSPLVNFVKEFLDDKLIFTPPKHSPAYGAYLIAKFHELK